MFVLQQLAMFNTFNAQNALDIRFCHALIFLVLEAKI